MHRLYPGFILPECVPSGWSVKRLRDVATVIQGGRLGLTKERDYISSGTPAYSAAGQDGFVAYTEFRHQPGVVLSAIGANCGRCFRANDSWTTLANTQAILPDPTVLDYRYLHGRIDDERYWLRSGSAQPFIKPSTVKNAWLMVPPLQEQRRIAEVLEAIDDKIDEIGRVAEKYRQVRDGAAHVLLACVLRGAPIGQGLVGQSQSKWLAENLADGSSTLGWRRTTLGDVAKIASGSAPPRVGGSFDLMGASGQIGSTDRANFGPGYLVGRVGAVGAVTRIEGRCWASDNTLTVVPHSTIDTAFLGLVLTSLRLDRMVTQTAQPLITQTDLSKNEFVLPPLSEQRKIAVSLERLDAAIRANMACLQKEIRLRSGMVNDLFSGRIRVVSS